MCADVEVSYTNVARVVGGCLKKGSTPWHATIQCVGGFTFIRLLKADTGLKRFVNGNMSMVDALYQARNDAVDNAMVATCGEQDDPLEDNVESPMPKRRRREMVDEIEKMLELKIKSSDNVELNVKVLPDFRKQGALWVELTLECLKFLLKTPGDEHVPKFAPTIDVQGVRWWRARHCVYSRYYDSALGKWRLHSIPVPRCSDNSALQEAATRAANSLMQFCVAAGEGDQEAPSQGGSTNASAI